VRLISFNWSGEPVSSCARVAFAAGRAYIRVRASSPLVERIWNEPRVGMAPPTARGSELARPLWADARVVAPDKEAAAERAFRTGWRRLLATGSRGRLYVELTPRDL
jgi:hypothetical protein